MDFGQDKTIVKLFLIVVLVLSLPALIWAYSIGGWKSVIFALWIIIAALSFISVVILTIDRSVDVRSSSFVGSYIDIWVKYFAYKVFAAALLIFLVFASFYLWGFLGEILPSKVISTS